MGLRSKLSLILLVVLLSLPSSRAYAATTSDISEQLICQCGCNMVLLNCSHAECTSRETMTALIAEQMAQGQSGEQIMQFMVAQYGEQVLAVPPKRGFNLTAWITPVIVLLFGGGVILVSLRTWVKRGNRRRVSVKAGTDRENPEYRQRLEKELEEFNGRGFR